MDIQPWSFAWLRINDREDLVFVTRVDGRDVFYRAVQSNDRFGPERVVKATSNDRIRPAPRDEFSLAVEQTQTRRQEKNSSFELSIPAPDGTFQVLQTFTHKSEAVREAKKRYGADSKGRLSIVNEVKP